MLLRIKSTVLRVNGLDVDRKTGPNAKEDSGAESVTDWTH